MIAFFDRVAYIFFSQKNVFKIFFSLYVNLYICIQSFQMNVIGILKFVSVISITLSSVPLVVLSFFRYHLFLQRVGWDYGLPLHVFCNMCGGRCSLPMCCYTAFMGAVFVWLFGSIVFPLQHMRWDCVFIAHGLQRGKWDYNNLLLQHIFSLFMFYIQRVFLHIWPIWIWTFFSIHTWVLF